MKTCTHGLHAQTTFLGFAFLALPEAVFCPYVIPGEKNIAGLSKPKSEAPTVHCDTL